MRIAIWSTAHEDKKQLLAKFSETWKNYKVIDSFEPLSDFVTVGETKSLLDNTMNNIMEYTKKDDVIYTNCTLDLLCHMFLTTSKMEYPISEVGKSKEENEMDMVMQRFFQLVRQSMHFYDVILYFPRTKTNVPETEYEAELNNFMNAINESYLAQKDWIFPFKDANGTPALVEFTGTVEENATMVKLYLNPEGKEYSKDDSLVSDVLG